MAYQLCLTMGMAFMQATSRVVPMVEVGTWKMISALNPDAWDDQYTQFQNGSFVGFGSGNWTPANYTYYGDVVHSACSMQADDTLEIMLQWWLHDEVNYLPDVASMYCPYRVWNKTSPKTRKHEIVFQDQAQHSVRELQAGNLPGVCPSLQVAMRFGIQWQLRSAQDVRYTFECAKDCGDFGCSPAATCADIKAAYKSSSCCGYPSNNFTFPDRRLSSSATFEKS